MRSALDPTRFRPENSSLGSVPVWQPTNTERYRPEAENTELSRRIASGEVRFIGTNEGIEETVDAVQAKEEMEAKFCKRHVRPKTKKTRKKKRPSTHNWSYEQRLAAADRMRERMKDFYARRRAQKLAEGDHVETDRPDADV